MRAKGKKGAGGGEGDFFVIVTIIFLQIPTVQTRAQLPLFFLSVKRRVLFVEGKKTKK